jgi:hypothetical protein
MTHARFMFWIGILSGMGIGASITALTIIVTRT